MVTIIHRNKPHRYNYSRSTIARTMPSLSRATRIKKYCYFTPVSSLQLGNAICYLAHEPAIISQEKSEKFSIPETVGQEANGIMAWCSTID